MLLVTMSLLLRRSVTSLITYGSKSQYWFGIPRNVSIDSLTMDVDHISHLLVHESNDTDLWIAYNRVSGARLSAMEHLVPEQMFSTEDNPAHGISAVKAIQIAAAEGQKIWTITQANLSTALAAIDLPSVVDTGNNYGSLRGC